MDQVIKLLTDIVRVWIADPLEATLPPGHPAIHDQEVQVIRLQTELALRDMAIAELEAEAAGLRRQLATRRVPANPGSYAPAAAGQVAALARQVAGQRALLAQQADLLGDQVRQLATQRRHLRARDGIIRALLHNLTGPPGALVAPTQPFAECPAAAATAPWGALPAGPAAHAHCKRNYTCLVCCAAWCRWNGAHFRPAPTTRLRATVLPRSIRSAR